MQSEKQHTQHWPRWVGQQTGCNRNVHAIGPATFRSCTVAVFTCSCGTVRRNPDVGAGLSLQGLGAELPATSGCTETECLIVTVQSLQAHLPACLCSCYCPSPLAPATLSDAVWRFNCVTFLCCL